MNDRVFAVQGSEAFPLAAISLSDAALKERQHLQEWVRKNPAMLGDGVMIVTFEFDKWISGAGINSDDRLDILGIDRTGRLVVVELKRGDAPDTTDMQAIKYAAMASRFTLHTLAQQHARYLTNTGQSHVSTDVALELLRIHIGDPDGPIDVPSFERPRIILMATNFPSNVTSTAVFLSGFGLEVTLLRFQAFKTPGGEFVITVNRLFPIQEVEELRISPRAIEEAQHSVAQRSRRTVLRLIESHALENGATLSLAPDVIWEERLHAYIEADPRRRRATWDSSSQAKPLVWSYDNEHYSPTGLCKVMLVEAGFEPFALQGPNWWITSEGKTLVEVANALPDE